MEVQWTPRKVDFKFGDYISRGFDLLKENFMPIFLAMLCTFVMSIIPFCGAVAVSNFLKFLRKIESGEKAEASEIFNFDDFMKYFIPQLLIFGGVIALYIPYFVILGLSGAFSGEQPSGVTGIILGLYVLFLLAVIFYFVFRGFYIIGLMSLGNIPDLKQGWKLSKVMTQGNFWNIFLFSIGVGFLGEIGIIVCGIGIFFTIPFIYCAQYFAYKDGLEQIGLTDQKQVESPLY